MPSAEFDAESDLAGERKVHVATLSLFLHDDTHHHLLLYTDALFNKKAMGQWLISMAIDLQLLVSPEVSKCR